MSAPGQNTKQSVGRNVFSTGSSLIRTFLPPEHTFIQTFPSGLWSLHFRVSSPSFIFQLWYWPRYRWWICHDLQWVQNYSSPVRHWTLQLAPVSVLTLEVHFLRHHHLLVDFAGERLLEPATISTIIKLPTLIGLFVKNFSKDGKGKILFAAPAPLGPLDPAPVPGPLRLTDKLFTVEDWWL